MLASGFAHLLPVFFQMYAARNARHVVGCDDSADMLMNAQNNINKFVSAP